MKLRIELNGQPHMVDVKRRSVAHLVDSLALGGRAVAVAVNRRVVPAQQWGDTLLEEADLVDVVKAIGGG